MNRIKIYGISISICAVFVSLLINSSHAQSSVNSSYNNQSSSNFLNYTNNDMNFSIQYPSIFKFSLTNGSEISDPEVFFKRPLKSQNTVDWLSFDVVVKTPEPYLDTDTMTIKNTNTTLDELVQQELNYIERSDDKELIRQNEVSVGGNIGTKIEYTSTYYYGFTILTVTNGTAYRLSYHDDPLKVPETLPLANRMVVSFQINR